MAHQITADPHTVTDCSRACFLSSCLQEPISVSSLSHATRLDTGSAMHASNQTACSRVYMVLQLEFRYFHLLLSLINVSSVPYATHSAAVILYHELLTEKLLHVHTEPKSQSLARPSDRFTVFPFKAVLRHSQPA